jgi:hypothetical protein
MVWALVTQQAPAGVSPICDRTKPLFLSGRRSDVAKTQRTHDQSLVAKKGVEPIELNEPREAVERAGAKSELLAPVG